MTVDWATIFSALGGAGVGAAAVFWSEHIRWERERLSRYYRDRAAIYAQMVAAAHDLLRPGLAPNNEITWNRLTEGWYGIAIVGTERMKQMADELKAACEKIAKEWGDRADDRRDAEKEDRVREELRGKLREPINTFVNEGRGELDVALERMSPSWVVSLSRWRRGRPTQ